MDMMLFPRRVQCCSRCLSLRSCRGGQRGWLWVRCSSAVVRCGYLFDVFFGLGGGREHGPKNGLADPKIREVGVGAVPRYQVLDLVRALRVVEDEYPKLGASAGHQRGISGAIGGPIPSLAHFRVPRAHTFSVTLSMTDAKSSNF